MGLYDRDYTKYHYRQFRDAPQMRFNFPRISPAVKWLLIINISVHIIKVVLFQGTAGEIGPLEKNFTVFPVSLLNALQIWRLITYQFLHWSGWHLFANMLGLFFLGPTLERHWGTKKFTIFYLSCGAAGGAFYLLLAATGFLAVGPMAGASGSILGMLAACAILFPHFVVFIILFPVPIRVAAVGLTVLYCINILSRGGNAGGDAAHLAGLAAGAGYVLFRPWRNKIELKRQAGRRGEGIAERQNLHMQVDYILKKIQDNGIGSLTSKERKILKKATKNEQIR